MISKWDPVYPLVAFAILAVSPVNFSVHLPVHALSLVFLAILLQEFQQLHSYESPLVTVPVFGG